MDYINTPRRNGDKENREDKKDMVNAEYKNQKAEKPDNNKRRTPYYHHYMPSFSSTFPQILLRNGKESNAVRIVKMLIDAGANVNGILKSGINIVLPLNIYVNVVALNPYFSRSFVPLYIQQQQATAAAEAAANNLSLVSVASVPTPDLLDSYSDYSGVCELMKYLFEVTFMSPSSVLSLPPSSGSNSQSLLNMIFNIPLSPSVNTPTSNSNLRVQNSPQSIPPRIIRGSPSNRPSTPDISPSSNFQISPTTLLQNSNISDSSAVNISLPSTAHSLSVSNLVPKSSPIQSGQFSPFPFTLVKTCNLILAEGMIE
jgi:hypothetical protein